MREIHSQIEAIIMKYEKELNKKLQARMEEMKEDNTSHYMIYELLGVSKEEGALIDLYQNKGRFLYNYAGRLLEDAVVACYQYRYPDSKKAYIQNPYDQSPKRFEIDRLIGNRAYEIKWRDGTTDGDHTSKEKKKVSALQEYGLTPIRIMFFYPNRKQASDIQQTLSTLYPQAGGYYYAGQGAWDLVKEETGIDLKQVLESINQQKKIQFPICT